MCQQKFFSREKIYIKNTFFFNKQNSECAEFYSSHFLLKKIHLKPRAFVESTL